MWSYLADQIYERDFDKTQPLLQHEYHYGKSVRFPFQYKEVSGSDDKPSLKIKRKVSYYESKLRKKETNLDPIDELTATTAYTTP